MTKEARRNHFKRRKPNKNNFNVKHVEREARSAFKQGSLSEGGSENDVDKEYEDIDDNSHRSKVENSHGSLVEDDEKT